MPCWPGKKKKIVSTSSSLVLVNEKKSIIPSDAKNSIVRQYFITRPAEAQKVLESVFSYLSLNELLKVRLVSKRWNSAACQILRRKIEGAIILQRGLSYYTRVMSRSLDIPVGRLFLKIDNMDDPASPKFFQVVGPSILFLVLNLEGSSLSGFLEQVQHLKNVEQLSLNLFQEEEEFDNHNAYRKRKATSVKIFIDDYDNPYPSNREPLEHLESFVLSCEPDWKRNEAQLLEKLLQMCPNLKNLNLNKWPFTLKPDLFERCRFINLKYLSLKTLDDIGLSILGKKIMENLKTFECELSPNVSQESLQIFLENVADSLEYLEIKSSHNSSIMFKIPAAMKLVTIRLTTWVGPVYLESIVSNTPCLEKLQLSNVSPDDIYVKDVKDAVKQAPQVEYLAVNFGNGSHSMKKIFRALRAFIVAFPNLKVFMMKKVSDKILEMICEAWPELEALRITTSFALSDSGVTGIPNSMLQKIQKMEYRLSCGCCVPIKVENGKADYNSARVTPHIGLLKKLKDLRIEAEVGSNWTLTNLSLHLGLNELRQLTSLRLTCHELGPHWCLRCIADNLPNLLQLTVMDRAISHDRYDEQELHYLLRKLPKLNLTFAEADSYTQKRGSSNGAR